MTSILLRAAALYVLAVWAISPLAWAGAREQLDAFTRNLTGLDGQFTQQVLDESGQLREESSGRVALSVPRLLRWETSVPYPQLIVADGSTVWIFDPDLEQVTRRAQDPSGEDSPLLALTDPVRLERDWLMAEAGTRDGLDWLSLHPRRTDAENGLVSAQLGFDHGGLARMDIVDALGQTTRFTFSHWQRNPEFAAGTFAFIPPDGVDVVGGDAAGGD